MQINILTRIKCTNILFERNLIKLERNRLKLDNCNTRKKYLNYWNKFFSKYVKVNSGAPLYVADKSFKINYCPTRYKLSDFYICVPFYYISCERKLHSTDTDGQKILDLYFSSSTLKVYTRLLFLSWWHLFSFISP